MDLIKDQLHVELGKRNMPIKLAKADLIFFQQLLIHRTLSSSAIHELYKVVDQRSTSGITNRLRRFLQAGLLVRDKDKAVNKREVFMQFYYRMGKKAFDSLTKGGFIDESHSERLYLAQKGFRNHNLHNQSVSVLAHRIWCHFYEKYELSLIHQRGSELSFVKNAFSQIVPDWMFQLNDVHIMLEVDTGTERSKEISKKVEGYIALANNLHPNPVHVVFSVLDNTVDTRIKELSRYKRIKSLKNIFPPNTDIPDNLHLYAVRFSRTTELVEKLLLKLQPVSAGLRRSAIKSWTKNHCDDLLGTSDVTYADPNAFYPPRITESHQADAIILIRNEERAYYAAMIFGEEGSSQTNQSIYRHQRWLDSGLLNIDQLIVIYPDKDQAVEDIIQTRDDRIFFSYRHKDKKSVEMYYAKSLQTKEVIDYASITSTES